MTLFLPSSPHLTLPSLVLEPTRGTTHSSACRGCEKDAICTPYSPRAPARTSGPGLMSKSPVLPCRQKESESEVAQSCPTLCDPTDSSPPGSSVHGIFQARVLEWGAIGFSVYSLQTLILRKYRKGKIYSQNAPNQTLELQRPWTESLSMALACIRATPWALSFLSPSELMYGCRFLLGQFPTATPLLGEYLPTLNLIRYPL